MSKNKESEMSPDEVKEILERTSEFMLEMDNLKPQEHKWVDRGVVQSCEIGTHPNHRVFKRR